MVAATSLEAGYGHRVAMAGQGKGKQDSSSLICSTSLEWPKVCLNEDVIHPAAGKVSQSGLPIAGATMIKLGFATLCCNLAPCPSVLPC